MRMNNSNIHQSVNDKQISLSVRFTFFIFNIMLKGVFEFCFTLNFLLEQFDNLNITHLYKIESSFIYFFTYFLGRREGKQSKDQKKIMNIKKLPLRKFYAYIIYLDSN